MIREGKIEGPTSGMCAGYAQANLVILPKELAYDFLLFTQRNPKSCPILEVSDVGSRKRNCITSLMTRISQQIFRSTASTDRENWKESTEMWKTSGRMTLSAS